MKRYFDIERINKRDKIVATIGSFDGVHRGHVAILQKTVAEAERLKGKSLVISFITHPREVINPDFHFKKLSRIIEKEKHFSTLGINKILYLPFNKQIAAMTYVSFLETLSQHFCLHTLVMGYNNTFGHNRDGNLNAIKQLEEFSNLQLIQVAAQYYKGEPISSSRIRRTLEAGDIRNANKMLGYAYTITAFAIKNGTKGVYGLFDGEQLLPKNGRYITLIKGKPIEVKIKNNHIYIMEKLNYYNTLLMITFIDYR